MQIGWERTENSRMVNTQLLLANVGGFWWVFLMYWWVVVLFVVF